MNDWEEVYCLDHFLARDFHPKDLKIKLSHLRSKRISSSAKAYYYTLYDPIVQENLKIFDHGW